MSVKNDILLRFGITYAFILLIALAIAIKVFLVMFVEGDRLRSLAKQKSLKDITIEAVRGEILADDGRILAASVAYYDIFMDTRAGGLKNDVFNENVGALAKKLAELLPESNQTNAQTAAKYKAKLKNGRLQGARYLQIAKNINHKQLKALRQFPIFNLGANKGGIIIIQKNIRKQPFKLLASRTIGRVKNEGETHNVIGIEGAYDYELAGRNGLRLATKVGSAWMPIPGGQEITPIDGRDIITSLDINLQDVAEHALYSQLSKHGAHHGTAILMEVKTGEIKAIANLADTLGNYRESYNYGIGFRSEPGSTFKLASMIALLEDNYISANDLVHTGNGITHFHNFPVRDSKKGGLGTITVQEAFELSSNVAFAKLVVEHYGKNPKKFVDRLYSMNLNDPLGIELKGEDKPYMKYPGDKLWSNVSLPQMSIGYEILLTPLQTLAFYNAIANGGKFVKPKFAKAVSEHGRVVREIETEVINSSICSEKTIKTVHKMLVGVVENGTAMNIRSKHYKIAGKTGTALMAFDRSGYAHEYQASFVGYFPADNPQYSCIVVISRPQGSEYYGNLVAAPVFKEIADKVYATRINLHKSIENRGLQANAEMPITKNGFKTDLTAVLNELGISPKNKAGQSNYVVTVSEDKKIVYQARKITGKETPKVIGMGARDAVAILENLGMKVKVHGRGRVVRQSILPGKGFRNGDYILLTLSKI
ncbi:MAG TPA: peptidoglycan glycosyltransferase [Bacteroidales bacterium]|nr:peptidoglycan glycosyltransferase [Bacteroidales bacterium]